MVIADLADMQMKDPDMAEAILTAFRLGLLVDTGKRQNGKIVYMRVEPSDADAEA